MTILHGRYRRALVLVLAGWSTISSANCAPVLSQVAPGVWRMRFATPEKMTPMTFRSATANITALKTLPSKGIPPLAEKQIVFSTSAKNCAIRFPLEATDHLYGFGLSPSLFEMNGRRVDVRPTDSPENPRGESHAPVPLYVSTRGYAVYVDTARFAQFFCGVPAPANIDKALEEDLKSWPPGAAVSSPSNGVTAIVPKAQGLDVYLFEGPTMLDAVRRYNLFAGGGPVPPLWGLGIWYRGAGNFTAQDSLNLARTLRDEKIPCDVWGVEPGWQTHAYSCSFVWNLKNFPDPDSFIHALRTMGYRSNFWEHAFTHPSSPIFKALEPWAGDRRVWEGLVPDFASPKGRQVFLGLQQGALFSRGADGVKLDECDDQPLGGRWSFPEETKFPSGLDGEQMHSLFGVLYQQTMLEPFTASNLRTWGLVRNSGALATSLPYGVYSDSYDHAGYIRGLLNGGFSGLMWVPEVRVASSPEDLYRRVETAIFAPITQINAWFLKNPPWLQIEKDANHRGELMSNRKEITAVVRQLFELRMSLVPYLYSAFNEYRRTGAPPIRPLIMDWPDDPAARNIDDEFMFGASLLVAPRVADRNRQVYLPAGTWHNFWTGARLEGGRRVPVSNEPAMVPIFVKTNSVIPLAKPVEFISDTTCFDITAHVYGDGPSSCTLYEDDGLTQDFARGAQNVILLIWDHKKGVLERRGAYPGEPRYRLTGWTDKFISPSK